MGEPMRIRAQSAAGQTTVRILMSHEMESGQRKDADGKIIPAWHIQDVTASLGGKEVFSAYMFEGMVIILYFITLNKNTLPNK